MNQKSGAYLLLKIFFILAFLPFVLVWAVWQKTDWNKRNKWLATTGIVVVFLFLLASGGENKETPSPVSEVKTPQEQANVEALKVVEAAPVESENKVSDNQEAIGEKIKVARVVDGDTIKLENGKVVRYIGIDTPETVDPRKPVQCFGKEASAKNRELVEGKEVTLVKDVSETDKYGRLLRYVYVGDTFVNDYLVKNGYAHSSSYPPDVKYQDQFKKSEEEARNGKLGLWADGACKTETAPTPVITPTAPTTKVTTPVSGSGSFACNCSKTCDQMSSCAEAQYQLNTCGCTRRDADHDGIACDADCQ